MIYGLSTKSLNSFFEILCILLLLCAFPGVGGHGGIGRRGDSESRFRDILDRIARYIAGHLDAPVFNRQLFLPDVFATSDPGAIGGVDAGSSRTTRLVAIRSDHLLSARSAQRASSPQEETGRLEPSTSSASQVGF